MQHYSYESWKLGGLLQSRISVPRPSSVEDCLLRKRQRKFHRHRGIWLESVRLNCLVALASVAPPRRAWFVTSSYSPRSALTSRTMNARCIPGAISSRALVEPFSITNTARNEVPVRSNVNMSYPALNFSCHLSWSWLLQDTSQIDRSSIDSRSAFYKIHCGV